MGSLFDDILRAVGITSTPTSRAVRKTGQTGNRPKPSPRREGASRAKKQAASRRLIAAGRALGRPSKTRSGKTKAASRESRPGLLTSKGRRAAMRKVTPKPKRKAVPNLVLPKPKRKAVPKRTMANPPRSGPPAPTQRKVVNRRAKVTRRKLKRANKAGDSARAERIIRRRGGRGDT